jgi:hypothetical protein
MERLLELEPCERHDTTCWEAATRCYSAVPEGLANVSMMVVNGRVVRISIETETITTIQGAGIGDTEARINQLYAGQVESRRHAYDETGHYLIVRPDGSNSQHGFVFETNGRIVTRYHAGAFPTILAVEGCL